MCISDLSRVYPACILQFFHLGWEDTHVPKMSRWRVTFEMIIEELFDKKSGERAVSFVFVGLWIIAIYSHEELWDPEKHKISFCPLCVCVCVCEGGVRSQHLVLCEGVQLISTQSSPCTLTAKSKGNIFGVTRPYYRTAGVQAATLHKSTQKWRVNIYYSSAFIQIIIKKPHLKYFSSRKIFLILNKYRWFPLCGINTVLLFQFYFKSVTKKLFCDISV